MSKSEIYLLPTPLGDETDRINDLINSLIGEINPEIFFVESRNNSAKIIKRLVGGDTVDDNMIRILNVNTTKRDFEEFFELLSGRKTLIMSDGGMPGISDPGRKLIREAHRQNVKVTPLFSTSSVTTALASSGLNGEKFMYHGYPPRSKDERIKFLQKIEADSKANSATQIFIEAPFRNIHVWKDLLNFCDENTELSISVELFTSESIIMTARLADWKSMKWPNLKDKRSVFLINAQKKKNIK